MATEDLPSEEDTMKACQLSVKAHLHLIELIVDRDADGATNYWRDHLTNVRKMLFQHHKSMRVIDILD